MIRKSSAMAKRAGVTTVLLVLLMSSPACKTRPNLVIHQSDTLSVVLRELPVGYPSIEPRHHPYTIQTKEAVDILESLNYEAGSFLPFSRSQPRRVFTNTQAELLAPELSKALSTALPQEVAAFIIAEPDKPDRQTKGLAFILNDELHLIIEELRRPRYEGEQKTYQQPAPRWNLLTAGTQRLYAHDPGGKGTIGNWIVTPLR